MARRGDGLYPMKAGIRTIALAAAGLLALAGPASAKCGWYLFLPPFGPEPVKMPEDPTEWFDTRAPLSAWEQTAALDSAADCETGKRDLVKYGESDLTAETRRKERAWTEVLLTRVRLGRCIATDDPRLAPSGGGKRDE